MRIFLAVLLLVPFSVFAQSPHMTVEQKAFISAYVEAARDKDADDYFALIHPEVRSCMSANLVAFAQDQFLQQSIDIKGMYQESVRVEEVDLSSLERQIRRLYRDKAFLDVAPDYVLSARVRRSVNRCGERSDVSVVEIPVAFYQGRWHAVLPCGKNDLDGYLGKQLAAKALQEERTEAAYDLVESDVWTVLAEDKIAGITLLRERYGFSRNKANAVAARYCDGW